MSKNNLGNEKEYKKYVADDRTPIDEHPIMDPDINEHTVEPNTTVDTIETVIGIVTNCERLNIRKSTSKDADVAFIVNAGEQLTIDTVRSTNEWYSVVTDAYGECFCMKHFVDTKR